MAPVININGPGTGDPKSIGRRVGEAMQRPGPLDEIKKARAFEGRLGYV